MTQDPPKKMPWEEAAQASAAPSKMPWEEAAEQQPPFPQAPTQQAPAPAGSVGAPAGASPSTSAVGGGGAIAAPPAPKYFLPTEEELQAAPRPTIDQLRKEGFELQARSIEQQREREKVDVFTSRFADLDLTGVKKVRGDIEQRKEQIADLRTRMEAQRKAIEAAAPTSPEGADMALSEINSYSARISALDDLAYSVQRDEELANQREFNLKAKQGTIPGWLHNEFLQGIGSVAAGIEGFMIEAMARGLPSSLLPASEEEKATMTRDQLAKKWKREILPAMREMPEKAWGSETTPEYMQAARGTWLGSAAGGVTQSIPMMLTPAMSGFFVSGVDGYMRELEKPEFDDIPEAEKLALAIPGGFVANILERYGFRNLVANKSALYEVTRAVLGRVPENATIEQAMKVINAETPSAAKNYLSRSVGGFMSEAETGGMQEIADVSIRNLYNTIKGKKVLEEPASWYEFASDVTRSAIEEGIGGKIMAQVPAVSAAMRTSSLGENTDDRHFELVERLLRDKSYEESMAKHIDSRVESGDISLEDAERMKADWKAAQNISSRIPEDMSTARRRRVFDILTEKEKLSRMEPVLVREKIEQLDTKLAQAAGVSAVEEEKGRAAQPTTAVPDTPAPTMKDAQDLVGKVVEYNGEQGYIDIDEGGKVTFTTVDGGRIVEIGNEENLSALGGVSEAPIENVLNEDGSVTIGDNTFVPDFTTADIVYDDQGGVYSMEVQTTDGPKTFYGDMAALMLYENQLREASQDPDLLAQIETNITTDAEVQALIEAERAKEKRRIAERKRKRKGRKRSGRTAPQEQAADTRPRDEKGWTKEERDELNALIEQEELDTIEQRMDEFFEANKKHFKVGEQGQRTLKGNAPNAIKQQWADMRDTLGYKTLLAAEVASIPTQDGVQQEQITAPAEQAVLQPDERAVVAEPPTPAAPATEEGVAPIANIAPEAIAEIDDVLGVAPVAPATQPEGPVRPEGTGAIPVSERRAKTQPGGKRPMLYVKNVQKALSEIAPGLKVIIHNDPAAYRAAIEGYNAKHGTKADPAQSTAIYLPASEEIHLSPSADGQSLAHEAAHPIVSALITHRPEVFERLYDELAADPAMAKMLEFGKLYSDQDAIVQKAESIVRLMDAVASGEIKVSIDPKSAWQRFKRWLQDMLASIGFDTRSIDLSDPKNVREFAASFSEAINNGIEIKRVRGAGQRPAMAPSLQKDAQDIVDGWYSRLRRAVTDKGRTMPASEWKNWLQSRAKEGAFSMEEAKWTGLSDWLDSKGKEKVTPEQVREFLNENRVRVEVRTLDDGADTKYYDPLTPEEEQRRLLLMNEFAEWTDANGGGYVGARPLTSEERQELDGYRRRNRLEFDRIDLAKSRATKFSQHQLPGASNYREVLVTLPPKNVVTGEFEAAEIAKSEQRIRVINENKDHILSKYPVISERPADVQRELDQLRESEQLQIDKINALKRGRNPSNFRSSHFDEPNILVHLRLNDRTGPNGEKILFIEELQSDWGQAGKKKGFRVENISKEDEEEITSLRKAAEERAVKYQSAAKAVESERVSVRSSVRKKRGYENVLDFARLPASDQKRAIIEEMDAAVSASERIKELEAEAQKLRDEASDAQDRLIAAQEKARAIEETPPLAPFVEASDAWVELGLKQAVRMAVEGGYDRIAWTTGEQQYDRWGSQVFSWTKRGDNWYVLGQEQAGGDAFAGMEEQLSEQAFSEGRQIGSREDLRELVLATMGREKKDWSPENWKKHIDKITDGIWQQMKDGKDGSTMPRREGMKGFYDRIVPQVAQKVIKKMGGGKVGSADVKTGEAQPSFDITPEMRASVMGGVPLMQRDQAFNGPEQPKTPIGDAKTVTVDGKERTAFNSNGKPIHPTVEGVRNFWRWFGDSKVVDEQGRPLVVYHGTTESFDTFREGTIHLSDSKRVADQYARGYLLSGSGSVMEAYVRIFKPADITTEEGFEEVVDRAGVLLDEEIIHDPERLYDERDALQDEGYDGIIVEHESSMGQKDGTLEYIVFDSSDAKSATGNYGTFDQSKPSILEQRRDPAEVAAVFAKHGMTPEAAAAYMQQKGIDLGFAQQVVDAMQQPAPAQQPKQPEKAEEKKPERAKRKTTKRLVASRPELEKVVTDEMVYYERLPNDVTEAEALSVIEADGVHGAAAAVLDRSNPMSLPVRVVVGGVVLNRLREEKRYDEMIEFGEEYVAMMTELGQGVQALQRVYGKYWDADIAIRNAQKAVAKDREKRKRAAKKTIDRLKKGLEQENAEAAEEVAKTASVRKKTSTASSAPTKTFASEVREAVETAKNKTVTAKAAKAAFDAMRGKLYSSVSPEMVVIATYYIERGARTFAEVAKVVAKRLGNKALPYLKGAYIEANKQLGLDDSDVSSDAEIDEYIFKANTDKAVEKLRKAIERKNKKEADAAIAELQQVSKDYGLWGQYREYAIDRLKRMQLQEIKQDIEADPPLREFTDSLVRNLSAQAREAAEEAGLEKPEPKKRRLDIEVIADAYKNFERYQEVWEVTRREMQAPYFAAMARAEKAETPEARAEAQEAILRERTKLERLDNYFGEVGPKPFAEANMAKAVKDGMKALDQKIEDIIRQHYTVYDSAKRSLQQKLVELAGLDGKEAEELASAVGAEFDRIATEKKRKFIRSVLPATDKVARKRKVKAVEEELVALTNAGAFSDDDFIKAYGEKMGWPRLTRENIQEIERLAERVQTSPEGRPRVEAIQDLLGYQQSIPGIDLMEIAQSVWYANTLSGYETQEVNVIANFANMILEASIATGRMASSKEQRKYLAGLWTSMAEGMATGKLEASAVWRTGYDPIRGQIQVPSTLERHTFKGGAKNPANYLKYVRRFMVASDAIFFEGNRSLRAYQLAVRMASADKKLDPSIDVRNRAAELLGQGNAELEQAKMQAQREYDDEVSAINSSSLGTREKQKALKKAELDRKRRVFELTEKKRPEPIAVGAAQFARRATYNYKPEGTLGAIANFINLGLQSLPAFRYVVPFTNVIANVANETLNYTPVGYIRAARDGRVFVRRDEFTPDQKADAIWKASIGVAAMAALYLLSHPTDDDDEPLIEVTANGFGDYRKNEVLREKGWRPYSFRIGKGPYISYQYTPLILAMGFIGNLNDYAKYRKKKVTDGVLNKWSASLGYTSLAFLDMTFLSSMNNVLSAAFDPRNEDRMDDLARGIAKTARSFVVPNLYTQGAKMVMERTGTPQKEVRGTMMGNLLKDIPVFRAQYQDAVNVLGEPVIPEWGRIVSMPEDDPVANFLGDKGIAITAPHPNTLTYTDDNGDERMYTDAQKHEFYVRRGQYIRQRIEANLGQFKDMDKKRLEKKIAGIAAKGTRVAKMGLLNIQ